MDKQWLLHERAKWVAEDSVGSRYSLLVGRTGTRLNIGRPQVRWEHGVDLAREVLQSRDVSLKGSNAMTIGTRIRNALSSLATAVQLRFNG